MKETKYFIEVFGCRIVGKGKDWEQALPKAVYLKKSVRSPNTWVAVYTPLMAEHFDSIDAAKDALKSYDPNWINEQTELDELVEINFNKIIIDIEHIESVKYNNKK